MRNINKQWKWKKLLKDARFVTTDPSLWCQMTSQI